MAINLLSSIECKKATSGKLALRKLSDGGGLYLWIFENGSKVWRFRYWWGGKEKLLAFGVYPHVSLQDARAKRDENRKLLEAETDPCEHRKKEKRTRRLAAANTFEATALEWYAKNSGEWSERHAWNTKRRLDLDLFPLLGSRPIAEIDAPELLDAIRKIETRGSHDLAGRVLGIAGQVFIYGIASGRCKYNLAHGLNKTLTKPTRKHQPAVRPEELPILLKAIAGYDEIGELQTRLALQLLSLTFVRTRELIEAKWSEFNFDDKLWTIPAERMKAGLEHLVPLSKQTIGLFEELKKLSGTSRFVLPGRNADKPLSNNACLFALYRLGYRSRMSGHGFRALASTILNEASFNRDAIERQLAHVEGNAVRRAYNRAEYLPERKKMMQWWADHLDSLAAESKVIVGRFGAA